MHPHRHSHTTYAFNRAFAVGIALNLSFVVAEAVAGWFSGSLALLADAGHNLSDVAGLALAWVAALAAGRRPDARHTYGWRRASILASFANAVLLLVAMGSLLWEALHRLQAPPPADAATVMLVGAIGMLINGATAALFMPGMKADMNLRGAFLHMAADALVSLGVVLAGFLYLRTGWAWVDPAASMVIALLIVAGTWRLFRQSLHLLFDGVPEGVALAEVDRLLRGLPGVVDVHDLHVWAMGTTETALTAHLVTPGGHPGDAFLDRVGRQLHDRFHITHTTLQIELDGHDHGCELHAGP